MDRTYNAHQFIFIFLFFLHFLFIPCGRLSWLSDSFLLHVKYTLSYRIESSVPLSRCPMPRWTRLQGGRVHYIHAAAEVSYDRTRYLAL